MAFLLFDGLTALDAVGPYEVLARLPGAEVTFVAPGGSTIVTGDARLRLGVDATLDQVTSADLLLVPGGLATRRLIADRRLLEWLRAIDRTTTVTASVCTGSLLLAAAGLLEGRRATCHWARLSRLTEFGAVPVAERLVRDGKYATAAGVSAGIDLGLALALELAGREVAESIQLAIEYDPAPPLSAGHPARVSPAIRDAILQRLQRQEDALAADR